MRALTKSNYLVGLECPRYLWVVFNQPEKIRKATLAEVMIIEKLQKIVR